MPVVFHDVWHFLFDTMTPWEACLYVELVMTQRTRQGWDKQRLLGLRCSIIAYTERMRRAGRQIDPLARRATRIHGPIRFDHVPGWWRDLHEFLFGDLQTVSQVHIFIAELMVEGRQFTGPQIIDLRHDVLRRHGLRVVHVRSA